ncbi:leucine-rich repeat domain-containing protein [Paenibacillus sp. 1P07SE]|uniref:leucine-rich repeat domain-containing protein n=1 Tax=Paenibacillus sp. 1P07SE TaxID=3132209 RepID=UPI0039A6230B
MRDLTRKTGIIALSIVLLMASFMSFPVSTVYAAVEGDFEYIHLGDGTAKITGYTGPSGGNVDIPGSVGDDLTVVEIGSQAFQDNQLTSITIPDSVTTIGEMAFRDNQLTELTLPSSITKINPYAFMDNQLTKLEIPDSVTVIGTGAFGNNALEDVLILNHDAEFGNIVFINNQVTLTLYGYDSSTIGF